ncbi:MAG: glycosyltransferase family 4 protein [bacterium]
MQKKKVLVIIPDRFQRASGGMGANAAPVFELLSSKYGYEFYVVGFPLGGTAAPGFVVGYHEVFSPYTETKFGPLDTLLAQAHYFAEAISFPKPNLVYAYDWSVYQAASETADFFNVPLVVRMSLSPVLLAQEGYTFGLNLNVPAERAIHSALCEMEVRGLGRADRVVQISQAYAAQHQKVLPFAKKTRLVRNGIDFEKWNEKRREEKPYVLPGGKGRVKIVFLGRFAEVKGVLPLCDARVPKEVDLIFIGPKDGVSPTCLQAIKEKVSREHNVYMLDALYDADKIRALRAADALIVPSLHEPFGTVGLEGLAAGCTVLSSRAGGLADYLTDETSIFCGTNKESIKAAHQTLLTLLSKQKETIREAGFAVCRQLTLEASAAGLDLVFREVV